ncbi:MAG: C1 family peptidase [Alphaproteobacteria bacterium]
MLRYLKFSLLLLALSVSIPSSFGAAATDADHAGGAAGPVKRAYKLKFSRDGHLASHNWLHSKYDVAYLKSSPVASSLPASIDLRSGFGPIRDQGQLGSCTAFSSTGALQFVALKEQLAGLPAEFSELFQYWNSRALEGTVNQDAGASVADAIKCLCTIGVCPSTDWAYSDQGTQFTKKPTSIAYADAKNFADLDKGLTNINNTDVSALKSVLASGFPVVFGFQVYSSFESQIVATTGIVPIPTPSKEQYLGGHAVVLAGYDDASSTFWVRNSWGSGWGLQGYCKIPYAYLTNPNLASDFWAITKVGAISSTPTPANQAAQMQATLADLQAGHVNVMSAISSLSTAITALQTQEGKIAASLAALQTQIGALQVKL